MLFQRSLRRSSFLFILFSTLLQVFPPFYLPAYLSILLPQLLYCWFPPGYFHAVISLFIVDYFLILLVLVRPFLLLLEHTSSLLICASIVLSRF